MSKEASHHLLWDFLSGNIWVIFLIWATWLSIECLILGKYSYIRIFDEGDHIFPLRLALMEGSFKYGFSYWYPYAICGTDRLALNFLNFIQMDSPLYWFLPGWLAYGLIALLQRFMAGYFTFLLCRDYLKIKPLCSLAAGLTYALSFSLLLYGYEDAAHSTLQTQFAGEMGMPFIIWSLEEAERQPWRVSYLLAIILGGVFFTSCNFAVSLPFVLVAILAWFILIRRKRSPKFMIIYVLMIIVALLGNLPTIEALMANSSLSQRAHWPLLGVYSSPEEFTIANLSKVALFLKSNLVFWCLGILGFIWIRFRNPAYLSTILLLGFCGVGVYLLNPFWTIYAKPYLGFLSSYQMDRFYRLSPFFAALSLGFGLNYFLKEEGSNCRNRILARNSRIRCSIFIFVIVFLILISCLTKVENSKSWLMEGGYAENYDDPLLKDLSSTSSQSPFRVATVAFGIHPAYANAYGLESVDGYIPIYSKRYMDFWEEVIRPLISRDKKLYNYFHNWGSRIYLFAPSDGSLNLAKEIDFSRYYNLNLLSLANAKFIISTIPINDSNLSLILSRPSQNSSLVSSWKEKVVEGFEKNLKGRRLFIYENRDCLPRCFLAAKIVSFASSDSMLSSLSKADLSTLKTTAFLENDSISGLRLNEIGFKSGEVAIMDYSPDRVSLQINADGPAILIITNSYSPYWIGEADGAETEVFPVDGAFCGFYIPRGCRNASLTYFPPYKSFY